MELIPYVFPNGVQGKQLMVDGSSVVFLSQDDAKKVPELNGSTIDYIKTVKQAGSIAVYTREDRNITSVTVHTPRSVPRELPYTTFVVRKLGLNFIEGVGLERLLNFE